jgi:molybdopterin synthase catalytic subunit
LTGSRKCCEGCEKVSGKIKKSTPVVKKNNLARENVVRVSESVVDFFKTRVPILKKPMPLGVQKVPVDRVFKNLKKRPRS